MVRACSPLTADDATQAGAGPLTAEAWRRMYSGRAGTVVTGIIGERPATDGYSVQSVPLSPRRSPGAPKFRPSRRTGPFAWRGPKKVHISASGIGTKAREVWFW